MSKSKFENELWGHVYQMGFNEACLNEPDLDRDQRDLCRKNLKEAAAGAQVAFDAAIAEAREQGRQKALKGIAVPAEETQGDVDKILSALESRRARNHYAEWAFSWVRAGHWKTEPED